MRIHYLFIALILLPALSCKKETKEIAADQTPVPTDVTFPCLGNTWTPDQNPIIDTRVTLVYNNKVYVFAAYQPIYQGSIKVFDGATWQSIPSEIPLSTYSYSTFGFVVGNKAYLGIVDHLNISYSNYFYEYDFATNTWTQKGGYPWQVRRQNPATFSIGNKGYIVGGHSTFPVANYSDTWEYNPATDTWTQKANCSFFGRGGAEGFSIGNKGYIVNGSLVFPNGWVYENSMLEYTPATDSWSTKAYFPGAARHHCESFVIGGMAYVGAGKNSEGYFIDFYKYNPGNNSWIKVKDLPSNVAQGYGGLYGSFSINSRGYVFWKTTMGLNHRMEKYTPKICDLSSPLRSDNISDN